jgi:hypothetical protein
MIGAEGALSSGAREALSQRPPGKGSITVEEIRWVMNHSEFDSIDARGVPNQGVVGLWRSSKKNRAKWEQTWAGKLLDAKDPEAEVQQRVAAERAEAEKQARAIEKLEAIFEKHNTRDGAPVRASGV